MQTLLDRTPASDHNYSKSRRSLLATQIVKKASKPFILTQAVKPTASINSDVSIDSDVASAISKGNVSSPLDRPNIPCSMVPRSSSHATKSTAPLDSSRPHGVAGAPGVAGIPAATIQTECTVCHRVFKTQAEFERHIKTVSTSKEFDPRTHKRIDPSSKPSAVPPEATRFCRYCRTAFINRQALESHLVSHCIVPPVERNYSVNQTMNTSATNRENVIKIFNCSQTSPSCGSATKPSSSTREHNISSRRFIQESPPRPLPRKRPQSDLFSVTCATCNQKFCECLIQPPRKFKAADQHKKPAVAKSPKTDPLNFPFPFDLDAVRAPDGKENTSHRANNLKLINGYHDATPILTRVYLPRSDQDPPLERMKDNTKVDTALALVSSDSVKGAPAVCSDPVKAAPVVNSDPPKSSPVAIPDSTKVPPESSLIKIGDKLPSLIPETTSGVLLEQLESAAEASIKETLQSAAAKKAVDARFEEERSHPTVTRKAVDTRFEEEKSQPTATRKAVDMRCEEERSQPTATRKTFDTRFEEERSQPTATRKAVDKRCEEERSQPTATRKTFDMSFEEERLSELHLVEKVAAPAPLKSLIKKPGDPSILPIQQMKNLDVQSEVANQKGHSEELEISSESGSSKKDVDTDDECGFSDSGNTENIKITPDSDNIDTSESVVIAGTENESSEPTSSFSHVSLEKSPKAAEVRKGPLHKIMDDMMGMQSDSETELSDVATDDELDFFVTDNDQGDNNEVLKPLKNDFDELLRRHKLFDENLALSREEINQDLRIVEDVDVENVSLASSCVGDVLLDSDDECSLSELDFISGCCESFPLSSPQSSLAPLSLSGSDKNESSDSAIKTSDIEKTNPVENEISDSAVKTLSITNNPQELSLPSGDGDFFTGRSSKRLKAKSLSIQIRDSFVSNKSSPRPTHQHDLPSKSDQERQKQPFCGPCYKYFKNMDSLEKHELKYHSIA